MNKIIIILCLVGLSYGQTFGWDYGVPTWVKFGDNPTGTIDMKGDTLEVSDVISAPSFTSPSATSYQYFASSAAADSCVWVQTGTAGGRDMVWKTVVANGTVHTIFWDYGNSLWNFGSAPLNSYRYNLNGGQGYFGTSGSTGQQELLARHNLKINANLISSGTLQLGETGDNDINYLNGRLQTNIITVDSTYVMGAADGFMFTMTANDTLKCPVTPLAGEVLECKFTNAAGGMVFGNGNNIDGATEVVASENDNIRIVWNATTSDWEIR